MFQKLIFRIRCLIDPAYRDIVHSTRGYMDGRYGDPYRYESMTYLNAYERGREARLDNIPEDLRP